MKDTATHGPALRHAPHVLWRRVGEEVVLLDLNAKSYYSLNATGARVWELVARGLAEEAIAEDLAETYGRPAKSALRDVSELLRRLEKAGLLRADL